MIGNPFPNQGVQSYESLHQLPCPGTPKQNGIVEMEHPQIMETGLTLLFHAHIPTYLWWLPFLQQFSYKQNAYPYLQNMSPLKNCLIRNLFIILSKYLDAYVSGM